MEIDFLNFIEKNGQFIVSNIWVFIPWTIFVIVACTFVNRLIFKRERRLLIERNTKLSEECESLRVTRDEQEGEINALKVGISEAQTESTKCRQVINEKSSEVLSNRIHDYLLDED